MSSAHGDERLEQVEERLFALRAAGRKHRVAVADLAGPARRDRGAPCRDRCRRRAPAPMLPTAAAARAKPWPCAAAQLSAARQQAARALGKAVMAELPPLKLDKASFAVRLAPLPEAQWSAEGAERVVFEVATNPGQEPGPLAKIASGGELARLMLAIKVVLARVGSVPSLVFDEVDTGIGGATAAAVGERLVRLGRTVQVLVVTHAPQIAARADHHWRVEKMTRGGRASVSGAGARARVAARGDRPHAGRRHASPTRRAPPPTACSRARPDLLRAWPSPFLSTS